MPAIVAYLLYVPAPSRVNKIPTADVKELIWLPSPVNF